MRAVVGALVVAVCLPSLVRADFSLVPIPEIITDPNEGVTVGLMPVMLLRDPQDRLEHMIASDLRYNKTTGWFPGFRLFGYPDSQTAYYVVARKSEKIDEEYEGFFERSGIADGRFSLLADIGYLRDSLQRFFGFGNASPHHDESNYTVGRFAARFRLTYRPLPDWVIAWQARLEDVDISRGGVHRLPFTGDEFPGLRGLEGATVHGEGLQLAYDDRDSITQPTRGLVVALGAELVDRALGASHSYLRYGLDVRSFVPLAEHFVLASHAALDYIDHASDAPYFELSRIGGVQAVRGFGEGRFVDANRVLGSVELRCEVFRRQLFGVDTSGEVAPFFDVGRVFSTATDVPFEHLHTAGGVGFRAVIHPQVVGYVDLGYGSEGFAAFTGLDYPF